MPRQLTRNSHSTISNGNSDSHIARTLNNNARNMNQPLIHRRHKSLGKFNHSGSYTRVVAVALYARVRLGFQCCNRSCFVPLSSFQLKQPGRKFLFGACLFKAAGYVKYVIEKLINIKEFDVWLRYMVYNQSS